MTNIFRSELIQAYAPTSSYNGNIVTRNGVAAMAIAPGPFWHGSVETSYVLNNEFTAGQYLFDIWIDTDDVVYNDSNVAGGLVIYYTDGTSYTMAHAGNKSNPVGFVHYRLLSDSSKTVKGLHIYYYTSVPVYYRYDSFIVPVSSNTITKEGIAKAGIFTEPQETTMSLMKGGAMRFSELVED